MQIIKQNSFKSSLNPNTGKIICKYHKKVFLKWVLSGGGGGDKNIPVKKITEF